MEKIERFLDHDLTGDELREFQAQLSMDENLRNQLELTIEVQKAVQESDIMELRKNLQRIATENQATRQDEPCAEYHSFSFGLAEEINAANALNSPVSNNDLFNIRHALPKIHLFQHGIAAKENLHQLYKEEQNEEESTTGLTLPDADEALFTDIRQALQETDISNLRANLRQIAANMPAHRYNTEEIDQFLQDELSLPEKVAFENELLINSELQADIELFREVDSAVAETDILQLRENLKNIRQTEFSTLRDSEEIERYISFELDDHELASFESELIENADLAAEVELFREVDRAVAETDIMALRSKLKGLGDQIAGEKTKQQSLAARMPSRLISATVAASLAIIMALSALLSNSSISEAELYNNFYQTYPTTGVFRSAEADPATLEMNRALDKFNSGKYEQALELFSAILEKEPLNPVGNFYAGVSFQETNRLDQAISSYQSVIRHNDNLFVEQANWYMALCYLRNEEREKAMRKFSQIAQSSSFYKLQAEAVIREMKKLE